MFGRAYRKYISQLWAYVAFKWLAIWVLIAACASRGQAGEAAALVVIAGDITLGLQGKLMVGLSTDDYTKAWHDRLTNRMFYKLFWQQLVAGGARSIDIDDLFRQATDEARADIKKASDDDKAMFGTLDKTGWHWVGGVLSFLWLTVSSILYYGSALVVGHAN